MALSSQTFSAPTTGSNQTFPITDFDIQREKYLSVTVAGIAETNWDLTGTTVRITVSVAEDAEVIITRTTDLADSDFLVQFQDPSTLRAEDLQEAVDQLLHICQELSEGSVVGGTAYLGQSVGGATWNAEGRRILDGPAAHSSILNATEFTTKAYVDATAGAAGNLPLAGLVAREGRSAVIKDDGGGVNGEWVVASSWTETTTWQVVGPGDSEAETLWTNATEAAWSGNGGYPLTSSNDGEMLVLVDENPNGSGWDAASETCIYNEETKAMEFEEIFFNTSQALRSGGTRGITLNVDKKTFSIFNTPTGWHLHMNLLVFAKRYKGSNWSVDNTPAFRMCIWDVGNNEILNSSNDLNHNNSFGDLYLIESGKPDVSGGVSTRRGNIAFPRSRSLEVGNLTWDDSAGNHSRSVAHKNDESFVFNYHWSSPLPVTLGLMQFRVLIVAAEGNGGAIPDWCFVARPTTLTISSNPGVNLVPL